MKPYLLLGLLLLTLPALAAEPRLQWQSNADAGLHSGQGLELQLQLLVPSYFLAAPQFPILQLDEHHQAAPEASRNLSPRIDGHSWAGIERTYHFAPLPPGDYQLQPGQITVRYADEQRQPREQTLKLPALHFVVNAGPAQADSSLPAQLRLTESYTPVRSEWQVGDILLRRLRIELDDAGTLLPPELPLAPVPGTRIYRSPPRLDQQGERVIQRYVREEDVRYLLLESGALEIPALTLQWRDTRNGQLLQLSLPARRLQVGAPAATTAPTVSAWQHLALIAAVIALLANALACSAQGTRWQRKRALMRDLGHGQPTAVLHALQRWLASLPASQRADILEQLAAPVAALQAACYGTASDWQPDHLRRALRRLHTSPAKATGQSAADWRINP